VVVFFAAVVTFFAAVVTFFTAVFLATLGFVGAFSSVESAFLEVAVVLAAVVSLVLLLFGSCGFLPEF